MKLKILLVVIITALIIPACISKVEKNLDDNYSPPVLKMQPRLLYPKLAQENSYFGKSTVILHVSKEGIVEKAYVVKSSGYDVLDQAAINYCKDLSFYPAEINGRKMSSKLEWTIKFDLSTYDYDSNSYLQDISELYKSAENAGESERNMIAHKILNKHYEFIQSMSDSYKLGTIVPQVLSVPILETWGSDLKNWPLSFLLYHDFITRFNNFDSISIAKSYLIKALRFDIEFINNYKANSMKAQLDKEMILQKIKNFTDKHYPEFNLSYVKYKYFITDLNFNLNRF